jgi:hypothetical protein
MNLQVMRLIPHLLTILVLLAGLIQLPGIWQPERDLGMLSEQNIEKDKGAQLGALPPAERDALIRREMDVLRTLPLDEDAHRNLALLSLVPPMADSSRQMILNLARHSMRNPAIQMAAMGVLIESGNLTETAYRVDAVLRSNPDLQAQIFPILAQNFTTKEGVQKLSETLSMDPPWRANFLVFLSNQPSLEKLIVDILRNLRDTKTPVKTIELKSIFGQWIKATGKHDKSYFTWLDQLSTDELRLVKEVYDGEFTVEPKNLYFDWNVSSTRNGKATIGLKPGSATDRALLVDFAGNRDPFYHVSQYLQLAPGQYALSYDVMSKNIVAETGLVWRVLCFSNSQILAESSAMKSPAAWTRVTARFTVPNEACDTQVLRLDTKSSQGLNTAIEGQIFYDSIAIGVLAAEVPQ